MPSMTRDLTVRAVLCLILLGCAKEGDNLSPPPPPPPPGPQAATLTLSQTAFPGNADEIALTVSWQSVSGAHTQVTRWRLPGGRLYEQQTQAVSGSQSAVITRLAVAGTPIADRRLYGTWRVEVFLDAALTPAASLAFRIGG